MFEEPIPPDLRQVELDVGSLMQFTPPVEFGHRLIGAVRSELRRERAAANWKFAIGLAAGAFLWLHLSFYVAPVTDFHFRNSPPTMANNSSSAGPQAGFFNWSRDE